MLRGINDTTSVDEAMLRTRHVTLYCVDSILQAHRTISEMPLNTHRYIEDRLEDITLSRRDIAYLYFWLGLYEQRLGNISAAVLLFNSSIAQDSLSLKWQPVWHIGSLLCQTTDIVHGRQMLGITVSKYPELKLHQDVQRTLLGCVDFNIPVLSY